MISIVRLARITVTVLIDSIFLRWMYQMLAYGF